MWVEEVRRLEECYLELCRSVQRPPATLRPFERQWAYRVAASVTSCLYQAGAVLASRRIRLWNKNATLFRCNNNAHQFIINYIIYLKSINKMVSSRQDLIWTFSHLVFLSWSLIFFSISASVRVSSRGHHWSASPVFRMAISTVGNGFSLQEMSQMESVDSIT